MQVSTATQNAFDLIERRKADVARAFTPGAQPLSDDVSARAQRPQFDLNPLAVAVPDDVYLVCAGDRGRSTYTRDGRLQLLGNTICGPDGSPMLGASVDSAPAAPIQLDALDVSLHRVNALHVESDGAIVYERSSIDPRTAKSSSERVVAGHIMLARFPTATRFQSIDATHVVPPDGVVPHLGIAGDGSFDTLVPGAHDRSRVDIDRSLDRLHDAYVAFDAISAANKAKGSISKTTMDLLK